MMNNTNCPAFQGADIKFTVVTVIVFAGSPSSDSLTESYRRHMPRKKAAQPSLPPNTFATLTRAQAQATAEGATRFSLRGSCVIAHRPSKARPGEEALCALVQQPDGTWRSEGWVS